MVHITNILTEINSGASQKINPDATDLVQEAYVRPVDVEHQQRWDGGEQVFAAAAEARRRVPSLKLLL